MSDMESSASGAKTQGAGAVTGSGGASRSEGLSWRRRVALVGIAALVLETVVALVQKPRVEPLRFAAPTTLEWWRHPIERNAIQRMPVSGGRLYAVHAARGTDAVWFAGEGGLIVRSTDGGRTWDSTNVRAVPQRVAPVDAPARVPARAASSRGRARGTSAPRASLVSLRQEGAQQYQNAPAQQEQYPAQQSQQSSKGQAPDVVVPNVVGELAGPAQKTIYGAKLRVEATYGDVSDPARADRIMRQLPAAGTRVAAGSMVRLWIGRYAPPVAQTPTPAAGDTTTRADSPSVAPPPAALLSRPPGMQ